MGVYARKDSKFWYLHLEGTTVRENTKIPIAAPTDEERKANRKLAEKAYNARMGDLAREHYALPATKQAKSFAVFASWYQQFELPKHRGAERELEILPRLVGAFGRYELKAITRALVDEWIQRRLRTPHTVGKRTFPAPSASTVNREIDVLKSVLQAAVPAYLAVSPLFGMKRLRVATPKRRLMSAAEEAKLLAALPLDGQAIVLLGLDPLIRLGDILDLRRRDDHGDRVWIADPKAGGGFDVPISKRVRAALDTHYYSTRELEPADFIFRRRRLAKTERDRRGSIRQMLEAACLEAGIPYGRAAGGLTFHWATRRTGATRMLTRGVDPGTVQKVGRWKSAQVVLGIYHELIDDRAREAVEAVGPKAEKP